MGHERHDVARCGVACNRWMLLTAAFVVACGPDVAGSEGDGSATSSSSDSTSLGPSGDSQSTSGGSTDSTTGRADATTVAVDSTDTAVGSGGSSGGASSTTTETSTTTGGKTTGEPVECVFDRPRPIPEPRPGAEPAVLEIHAGGHQSCALFEGGLVKCWGSNFFGQLGLGDAEDRGDEPGEMGDQLPFVDVGFPVASFVQGAGSTCASSATGDVKCWGSGYAGLGLGSTATWGDEPGEMGDALPFVDVDGAAQVVGPSCARLDNGIKCWGDNAYGQLGLGDTEARGDEPGEMGAALPVVDLDGMCVVETTLGNAGPHELAGPWRCARDTLGRVKCWGYNWGQLGLGDIEHRGDEPGEMGEALPFVDLGTGAFVERISSQSGNTCALLDTGEVKCWGASVAGTPNGGAGQNPDDMGDNLPSLDLGEGAVATDVRVGLEFACVLLQGGAVKCWDTHFWTSQYGQLGQGEFVYDGDLAALPPVDLGTGETAAQIAVGSFHVCVLLDSGNVKCWGGNLYGQLGLGHTESIGDEDGEMGDALPYVELL